MDPQNDSSQEELEPRAPTLDDLSNICGILNELGAIYIVVRIGDEITVNLMASAGGYDYDAVSEGQIIREVNGVPIPFTSPKMLYKMKELTHREKDRGGLQFLR